MKKIIIIFCVAAMLGACKKSVLELQNPNQITTEIFWKSEADVQSALAATYGLLRDVDGGFYGVRGIELGNGRGDDFFIRNDVADLYRLSTFTNNADNGTANSLWNTSYRAIFRANQILENVEKVTLEGTKLQEYIAEAKFLRGLNYFILAINFGDVPLVLETAKDTEGYFKEKSPEAEIWQQVIADFTAAGTDLPQSYPATWVGRATKGAGLAYLGKAYLYTKDYAKAEETLKQVTALGYQLMPEYGDNFIATRENNAESVFEIQLGDVGGTEAWGGENASQALGVTTAQEFAPSEVGGWFEAGPTDKLFNAFQKEKTVSGDFDPRMYATLVWNYEGATFYNRPFSDFNLVFGFKSLFKKYQNYMQDNELSGSSGASNYTSSNNERALRYADVLLMLAEALTMQGKTAEAYPYVKQIRDRAKLPQLATGLNQTQMMQEIMHQRMIEFARENQRFYDLKRWGTLATELANSDKVGKQFFVPGKHELFPIPQGEINANQSITQNPKW
ncbi:tetratricopeptide (TPR) repeat protein [Pedobacter sp. CAN_A7]|uniref:RagB/SusD family nutrient uptake outer membrane protein n=1 Tax=Pedobacter sp. CAN_A7 TaxID=2787722 RepID=UPI0018CA3A25